MRREWRLAIFDWDGTLADSHEMIYQCAGAVLGDFGLDPISKEEYAKQKSNYPQFYYNCGMPKEVGRKELNAIWQEKAKAFQHLVTLREGAVESLVACKERGMRTVIVSDNVLSVIQTTAATLGILDLIDHVYAEACGKDIKLRQALREAYSHHRRAFYVDDSCVGITAANSIEVTSIGIEGGVTDRDRLLQAKPNHLISSLNELPAVIF